MYYPGSSVGESVFPNRRSVLIPPGGGYARGPEPGLRGFPDWSFGECVPAPLILTDPAALNRAVNSNPRFERLIGWGTLRDQIEVNILGCPRANARLAAPDFAQAVALFQQTQGLTVDGMLGEQTWSRMKVIQVERDPFPRNAIIPGFDFNNTLVAGNCEATQHPAIDIAVNAGTPIPVVADGIVVYAGIVGKIRTCAIAQACQAGTGPASDCNFLSYGRVVLVEHPNRGPGVQPGGDSVYTIYAHVQFQGSHSVQSGEPVRAGRIVAEVGKDCVGFSGGPHLHYAVVTGPRRIRLPGGPARCSICARQFCDNANCPRCNFQHFWDVVVPQRPRTSGANAGFQW